MRSQLTKMRFELLSLKLFVTVCEQGSMARAAETQHIAASAVSKRITDLEKMIKAPLFYRRSSGLEMTPTGQALLHHARIVLRDIQEMELHLADHGKGVRGQIRVHASVSPLVQQLPADIAEFLRVNPAVRIDLREAISQDIVRAVSENEADIGIFGGSLPVAGLHVVPYRTERLVALMTSNHPLAKLKIVRFGELAQHELIGPKTGSFLDSLVTLAAADLSHPLKIHIRLNGFETAASMVDAGLGIALVPESHAERFVATRPLASVMLDEAWAVRQWKLCTREYSLLPAPAQLLVRHLSHRSLPPLAVAS